MEATQRQFARKKPDQLVYLELGSGNGGMLLSISEDGFRFRAVSPLRPSGLMPFAFSFDGNRRMQGIGEVEWLEDDGKSGGMRFVEISPDFRSELDQWLALDSPHGRSGREATPAAATPLDTMERIREELRRGYPQAPAKSSAGKKSQEASQDVSVPRPEQPAQKSGLESHQRNAKPAADDAERLKRSVAGNKSEQIGERNERHANFRATSLPPAVEREQRSQPASQTGRPHVDRKLSTERPQPFYPPPFTHPAESEIPGSTEKANSAFLKKPAAAPVSPPAENATAHPVFNASQNAATFTPAPPQSREPAHDSTEALRRPFRKESRSSNSDRPYIPPPVDESLEAAWERAKLTAPPESPHLSRAAAGSIIGVALAVILGALAFNFRQDIGQLVIDLGQKISGEHRTAAPSSSTVAGDKLESQTPADTPSSQTAPGPNQPDAAAGTSGNTAQPSGSPSNPADSHGAVAGTSHDAPLSSATRGSTSGASVTGTVNRLSPGPTTSSAAPTSSAGTTPNPANGSETVTEPGSGQEEFNAAREMLRGDHRHRDLSKAVELLWAGVRKGYVPAEVTLADLYRRGDGVTKNCDQAQVLLVAASKKGSPEARQMLEQMAEEGCTE